MHPALDPARPDTPGSLENRSIVAGVRSWNEPFELPGLWAPAGWSDEAVSDDSDPLSSASVWPAYGTLRFEPEDSIRVPVLGPTGDDFFAPTEENGVLHGQTKGGKEVSLLGTFIGMNGVFGGHAEREVTGQLLVIGAHVTELEDFTFDRIRIRLEGMNQFLWPPYLRKPAGLEPGGTTEWPNYERAVAIPSLGAELRLGLYWEGRTGRHSRQSEQRGIVEIDLDAPLSFNEWMTQWVTPLRDLVTFATREPCVVHSVHALHVEPGQPRHWVPDDDPAPEEKKVEFIARPDRLVDSASERRGGNVLFSFGELPNPEETLGEWFSLHGSLDPSAGALFTALTSRMYQQNRLLNLTGFAEGYHRVRQDEPPLTDARHQELVEAMLAHCDNNEETTTFRSALEYANQQGQRRRLKELFRRAEEALPDITANGTERNARVEEMVSTRNFFVHQDQRDENVREGVELEQLLRLLILVLQANLLMDLTDNTSWVGASLRRSYLGATSFVGQAVNPRPPA